MNVNWNKFPSGPAGEPCWPCHALAPASARCASSCSWLHTLALSLCLMLRRSPGNRLVVVAVVYPSVIFVVNILIKCRHRTRPTRMRADAWQVYLRDQTSRIAARSLATGHGLRDSPLALSLTFCLYLCLRLQLKMNAHKSIWLGVACLVSKIKTTQGNEIKNNNTETDTLNRGAELSPRSVHATVRAAHWTLCAQPAQKFTTPKSKLCQAEIDVQLSDSFCCSANACRWATTCNWKLSMWKRYELVVELVHDIYSKSIYQ